MSIRSLKILFSAFRDLLSVCLLVIKKIKLLKVLEKKKHNVIKLLLVLKAYAIDLRSIYIYIVILIHLQ